MISSNVSRVSHGHDVWLRAQCQKASAKFGHITLYCRISPAVSLSQGLRRTSRC
jgi:hypothetical protein